ncbi:hypothetical protein NC651_026568 [Populus alba x Populus x berolinensis]|nr:hypothetical protein NC651_026568 [Populus alba x Populus x berolinensis]
MAFCRGNPRLLRGLSSYFSRVNHQSRHGPPCSCFCTHSILLCHSLNGVTNYHLTFS